MTTHPNALIASDYVICVNLRAVPDIFNAEWLWDRVRIGQEGVLLLEALKRHPRRIARSAGQRQEIYYSHVVIRISERDSIRDERLEDGFGRHLLLRELRRLHERDLGEHLAENATIRYRLQPDPVLRPGQVHALFRRAIHPPGALRSRTTGPRRAPARVRRGPPGVAHHHRLRPHGGGAEGPPRRSHRRRRV